MLDLADEVGILRRCGGFWLSGYGLVVVRGADAERLLQARTSNDVASLAPGMGQENSLLDRTGHLKALFTLFRLPGEYWLVAELEQIPTLVQEIEFYIFREDVSLEDRSSAGVFWAIQGPESGQLVSGIAGGPAVKDVQAASVEGVELIVLRQSLVGEDGFLVWIPEASAAGLLPSFEERALKGGFVRLSDRALDVGRIEAGKPRFGVDVSVEDLITDTGLEHNAVSYSKGCYVGQEVVARIKTYGAPRKGLSGLVFAEGVKADLPLNSAVSIDGKESGLLKSSAYSPTLNRTIALAYLPREYRVPDRTIEIAVDGAPYMVTVGFLPFYSPVDRRQRARSLYEQGLAVFAGDDEAKAVELLRQSLALDPLFSDCYEALGVILDRQGQVDEAIDLMQELADIDPESVMAHANLSAFYLEKGDKESAEEEKALAMGIRMQKLAREAAAEQKAGEDESRKAQERQERLGMFREVLAIDADDFLANYGLGSICVETGDFEEGIPYLRKALAVKPTHTVAYLALGEALNSLGRREEAADVYRDGIAVAAKRGDMTPLKEMQSALALLKQSTDG